MLQSQKSKKAQSAIEFLILVGAMLLIFLSILLVFQKNLTVKSSEQRIIEVQELAISLQNELDIAAGATDGYSRSFQLPIKVIGQNYNISIQSGLVYIQTADDIFLALSAQNVTGQPTQGTNTIRKVNGEILLN